MIFVTVGSTDFDALIEKMDYLAPSLDEPIIMQIGLGSYKPKHGNFFAFAPSLDEYYEQADLVIAHGGLGTIVEALERGKKLICVVNPTTYDQHQEHLLRVFAAQNYLLWCKDLEHLEEAIQQAKMTQFTPYQPPECHIHEVITEYLNKI
ncbi:MAG: glycosyltransferase [Chloroflexi bacterium]|nr:glycosyltransferase [Chloroflexota bacterium]